MDGGRLLRSTLELFNVKKSLVISIRVTQLFCVAIFALGFWIGSWAMPLIGGLFFFTAWMELKKIKDDKLFEETVKEMGQEINDKIKETFKSHNMSDQDKLDFLPSERRAQCPLPRLPLPACNRVRYRSEVRIGNHESFCPSTEANLQVARSRTGQAHSRYRLSVIG